MAGRIAILAGAIVSNDLSAHPERSGIVVAQFKYVRDELNRYEGNPVVNRSLTLREPEEKDKSRAILSKVQADVRPKLPKVNFRTACSGLD